MSSDRPKTLSEEVAAHPQEIEKLRAALNGSEYFTTKGLTADGFADRDLMRFLLARDLDITKAMYMFISRLKWKESGKINVEEEAVKNELNMQKVFMFGTDNQGRPTVYLFGKNHDAYRRVLEESVKLAIFCLNELEKRMDEEKDITQFVMIADLDGFGWSNYDVSCAKEVFTVLLKYYPERLGKLYLVNTGFVFYALWKLLSPLLPSRTKEKICFVRTPSEYQVELPKLFPPEQLLEKYGGHNKLELRYPPFIHEYRHHHPHHHPHHKHHHHSHQTNDEHSVSASASSSSLPPEKPVEDSS